MLNLTLLNDYFSLCKPRVVFLMLITAWVGMYLASPFILQWQTIILATFGIACAAGSAAIINHLMDRHIDKQMSRTAARPIASGRVSPKQALIFATALAITAALTLIKYVNVITALLTFATLIGYAVIYTMYLKRATSQNIVIGGLSGAMPPLLGWTAITGHIHSYALLLVLIIFTWTPPHFWALAIYRNKDYTAANIPMLPVTHGIPFTKLFLFLYTLLLLAVTCLPFVVKFSGFFYLGSALILNSIFIYFAVALLINNKLEHQLAVKAFNFSIWYLFLLFIALLIDHRILS